MRKISYTLVYNRKKRLNPQGKALLQVEAYLERRKVYFSTNVYLAPEQWDNRRKLIRQHPNAEALNYKVREFVIALESKELAIWKAGRDVTLEGLKEAFRAKPAKAFLDFVKESIRSSRVKDSTKQNRLSTCKLLSEFRSHIDFKDLSPRFVHEFGTFLSDRRFKTGTVAKHLKHLKVFVNSAIDHAYIGFDNHPFRRYRIKMPEAKHVFLLPDELERLEALELAGRNAALGHTLEAFLFCCYTGMRYSDFTHLSDKNIVILDKEPWIIFHTVKTGTEVKLPLSLLFEGKAWRILRRHKADLKAFFSLKSNSSANKDLMRIGKLAGIEKHFSFHSARHTNATLLIYRGVNITTVQKLLGHRNLSTTQIYSEVMGSTIVKDLKRCSTRKR